MKKILIYAIICLIMAGCEALNIDTISKGITSGNDGTIAAGMVAFTICVAPLITNFINLIQAIKEHRKKADVVG